MTAPAKMPSPGNKAPDFNMPATSTDNVKLSDFKGQKVVLYFYPKDDTPGCTTQACGIRDNLPEFEKLDAVVIGVSKDPIARHEKFIKKYDLNFILASDADSDVCERYGVWVEKSMYGKKYFGIQRATFLIDETGKIAHVWPKVKPDSHADEVLEAIQKAQKAA